MEEDGEIISLPMKPLVIAPAKASLQREVAPTVTTSTDEFVLDEAVGMRTETSTDNNQNDSLLCVLSNVLFVLGGFFYIIATSVDYAVYSKNTNQTELELISVLSVLGPLVYFLNSVVDVKWALLKTNRDERALAIETLTAYDHGIIQNLLHSLRKNGGSRRSLWAAATFGLGAVCGLIAALSSFLAADASISEHESYLLYAIAYDLNFVSSHIYLLSAVFALWRSSSVNNDAAEGMMRNDNIPWHSNPHILFNFGDAIFGVAALIDVCLADVSFDDSYLSIPIVTSILWTADALLYMRGDLVRGNMRQIPTANNVPTIAAEIV
jgi:hypothetical protein